ncbi:MULTISPECIES: hypothetical protein [unclassified Crossiella]|uniref:hypothetical protein n=1 Tax=unclassified Crossiella TaxID=2620835 RepID=UPI001FFF4EB2|nr:MULTISPECIES: hypothetical protein [unclassified Crossiella]MCK2241868.1 hypothetical protein [Crossiella sp. S99.2]MCK2255771.1 hypothetical protein [Crossiella sp. S99.1]
MMALIVITSGKSSPGTTTTVAALTYGWPAPLVLADCDPAGGDLATGWLSPWWLTGKLHPDQGLLSFSTATRHTTTITADLLAPHLQPVPPAPRARLLAGLADPAQAISLQEGGWTRLAQALTALGTMPNGPVDVLVDGGRLTAEAEVPWPVLEAADLVLLAVRPVPRHLHSAQPALTLLRQRIPTERLGLAVCGTGQLGVREAHTVLGIPARLGLPEDPDTAQVFSDGLPAEAKVHRTKLARTAARAASRLHEAGATIRRSHWMPTNTGVAR